MMTDMRILLGSRFAATIRPERAPAINLAKMPNTNNMSTFELAAPVVAVAR
jgi:hypothetical protein